MKRGTIAMKLRGKPTSLHTSALHPPRSTSLPANPPLSPWLPTHTWQPGSLPGAALLFSQNALTKRGIICANQNNTPATSPTAGRLEQAGLSEARQLAIDNFYFLISN
jgi:hypothetical protein